MFSDRAFRKDGGEVFEAVGNVVVVSGKDTLYGESAHFDRRSMTFKVEGNVRLITGEIALYGSRLEYHALSGYAEIDNARIIHPQFNIVARRIIRRNEKVIETQEAEFTTCRDCVESWAVHGKRIVVYLDDRAEIHHGLAKVKGVSLFYLPYFVVPLQDRKTGLLFPNFNSRVGEGISLGQPFFWAIDQSRDATITPTFWAKRGYGGDLEYRQRFAPERWFQGSTRVLNDTIYLPEENIQGESGSNYTRYFLEAENHWLWTPDWVHHFRYTGSRDLDIMRDHPKYVEDRVLGSDLGFTGHVDGRGSLWSLSLESEYKRNQLFADPVAFDRSYVQTVPRVSAGTAPVSLLQTKVPFFQHILAGADGSFTRFRQVTGNDGGVIRNADRVTANPYINWHFLTWGPVAFKGELRGDYQRYRFNELDDSRAEKNATLLKTEFSFTMDRIFGLAYDEKVAWKDLPAEKRRELRPREGGPRPLSRPQRERKLVGKLPSYDLSLTDELVAVPRHSYRHSQEFKFIHHYITAENESGNPAFLTQIRSNTGWFDYTDAIRSEEALLGANTTRTLIPPTNTLEFQWNNVLIRKQSQGADWRTDQRYLRDNFRYDRLGFFNVSQGYLIGQNDEFQELRERLTRLEVLAGYRLSRGNLTLSEYFFHRDSEHMFQLAWEREFDFFNVLSSYNYNSLAERHNLLAGLQLRPTDALGFSYAKQVDLQAREDLRDLYAVDIMPPNNCWILSLNYEEALTGFRYSFNVMFNYGDEKFQDYRRDWFRQQKF